MTMNNFDFDGQRVVVMGLGQFGGGLALTRYLVESGADVLVTDQSNAKTLESSICKLNDLLTGPHLNIVLGPHDPAVLRNIDTLVVNPAVPRPWENKFIQHAIDQGIFVTTEIEIAYRKLDPSRIVAVTGSAGKSTTSAMIHHILQSTNHHSILGGNIGGSILSQLEQITPETYIVLELSSAMLYWMWGRETQSNPMLGPAVGCITNCSSNHLDWHSSLDHYEQSKKHLLTAMNVNGTLILGDSLQEWNNLTNAITHIIGPNDAIGSCTVPGFHNAINAAMAITAAISITQTSPNSNNPVVQEMVSAVRSFTGLPHRLNICHQTDSLTFYNDSKSTVPQATLLALNAVGQRTPRSQIHLIAGGYDKGSDLSSIAHQAESIAGLYTIGVTGDSIAANAKSNAFACQTLENAITLALSRSKVGDAILLSPGCASWDQFINYEERGNLFESLARQLTKEPTCSSSL